MHDLSLIAPSCGVLLGQDAQGRFEHVATAWCVGTNEWVTAWSGEEPPTRLQLLSADGVRAGEIGNWELDHGIAGFTAATPGINPLPVHRDQTLRKRDRLWALGYPSMIDHPAFRLHRGSLNPERYLPYLCPWTLSGHRRCSRRMTAISPVDATTGWAAARSSTTPAWSECCSMACPHPIIRR